MINFTWYSQCLPYMRLIFHSQHVKLKLVVCFCLLWVDSLYGCSHIHPAHIKTNPTKIFVIRSWNGGEGCPRPCERKVGHPFYLLDRLSALNFVHKERDNLPCKCWKWDQIDSLLPVGQRPRRDLFSGMVLQALGKCSSGPWRNEAWLSKRYPVLCETHCLVGSVPSILNSLFYYVSVLVLLFLKITMNMGHKEWRWKTCGKIRTGKIWKLDAHSFTLF